jgi:hypothetical protein
MRPTQEQKSRYRNDGSYLAKNFLQPAQLAQARAIYDFCRANPGKRKLVPFAGTPDEHLIIDTVPGAWENGISAFVKSVGFNDYLADLWGSEHVWYFGEELFAKEGGTVGGSPWHQDHSAMPIAGNHWANMWISFEPLPAHNSIATVRGSHNGKLYNGAAYQDANNPTQPLHPDSDYERLPDISADLQRDANSWDIATYDTEPGDVVVFHPFTLHGGAPVDRVTPNRHTLVLRFFGDDATYHELPNIDWPSVEDQTTGAPFRHLGSQQLR